MKKKDRVAVYLETGSKRTFAGAVDWPGWTRAARDEAGALEALLAYAPRYAKVVRSFRAPSDADALDVVAKVDGGATTDFGAPEREAPGDERPLDAADLARQLKLLDASWRALERAASAARGKRLRTGPRGGGRDLDKMMEHVRGAERAYLSKLGTRSPADADADELRDLARTTLRARSRDEPIEDPSATRKLWSPRYYVRRAAWHVLDHAWEIEDRLS